MLRPAPDAGLALARAVTGALRRRDVRIAAGDVELHCVIWGREQDPPVLLVHGNGAHAHWWDPLVPTLARGHRLLAADLRGHGESGHSRDGAYGLVQYERDLAALLDRLAPGPVPIIAHSMGARVAVHFAAQHPERVAGLALIDTRFAELDPETVAAFRAKIRARPEGSVHASYEAAVAAYRLVPDEPGVPGAVLRDLAHHALVERAPGQWGVRFDRAILLGDRGGDLWDTLARVRCPVRVAFARRGPVHGDTEPTILRARFPHVRLDTFEGGHHLFLANPEPTGAWLVDSLESLGRGL